MIYCRIPLGTVVLLNPASAYIIAVILCVIVGTYIVAIWRKMSFTAATVIANIVIYIICSAPMKYTITTKNVVGASSGKVILRNWDTLPAPSISAAS